VLWDVRSSWLLISSSWTSCPLKMGQIRCSETSVKSYYSTLCNNPEERKSHQHCGWSLKSRIGSVGFQWCDHVEGFKFNSQITGAFLSACLSYPTWLTWRASCSSSIAARLLRSRPQAGKFAIEITRERVFFFFFSAIRVRSTDGARRVVANLDGCYEAPFPNTTTIYTYRKPSPVAVFVPEKFRGR
jgi:hypothetical protein